MTVAAAPAATRGQRPTEVLRRAQRLARPADVALAPAEMGVARATRHSFNRSFLRVAARERWSVERTAWDVDGVGRGRFVYRITTPGHLFHLVGFTQVLTEDQRTDRVVAQCWDATAALVEGEVSDERLAELEREVPQQEAGRAPLGTLVWTRANRSARAFDAVVDALAHQRQPDLAALGGAAYVMRSTAFYGNGKFGLSGFGGYADEHPLAMPYRAQMLAAWLMREFSYDLVEHCAAAIDPQASRLDGAWRRFFGLGNATGLGMVPYIFNHPAVLDAWCALRELPLAHALARPFTMQGLERVLELLERAEQRFIERRDLPTAPYPPLADVAAGLARLREALSTALASGDLDGAVLSWPAVRERAAVEGAEITTVLDSVLVEDTGELDEDVEQMLRCVEDHPFDPGERCADAHESLAGAYSWLEGLDLSSPEATEKFWFTSENNEEPRRGRRGVDPGEEVEHPLGVALDVAAMLADLREADGASTLADFLLAHPWHRGALVRALSLVDLPYGEVRTNLLAGDFLPLDLQRFQLAVYGMDHFSPMSTDWLRVTLNSGAPRVADVAEGLDDDWLFAPGPVAAALGGGESR